LQRCDAAGMACAFTEDRDYHFFVDGDKNEGIDDAEDGDRTCWNYEVGAEFSVHDVCLADEEG